MAAPVAQRVALLAATGTCSREREIEQPRDERRHARIIATTTYAALISGSSSTAWDCARELRREGAARPHPRVTPHPAVRGAPSARIAGRLPLGAFFGATIALS